MSEHTKGFYVVGEGNDGTGKSTQIELLADYFRDELDIDTYVLHEPAGCPIANEIRTIIKNGDLQRDAVTNLLLFTAARHETWFQEAMPVLERGGAVLSARNDMSTEIYQGIAEGLGQEYVRSVTTAFMNERYLNPDLAVVFELPTVVRNKRIAKRGELENPDTFESRGDEFQQKIDEGYRSIARERGLPIIDASRSIEAVQTDFRALTVKAMVKRALTSSI